MNDSMQITELVDSVIRVVIIPVLPFVTAYIIAFLKRKIREIDHTTDSMESKMYDEIAESAVVTALESIYQTSGKTILQDRSFASSEEMAAVFSTVREKAVGMLSDTAVGKVGKIHNDFDAWLENKVFQYDAR